MTRPPLHPSVDYSFDGVVAEIRLSRPERLNAVDVGLTRGLVAALTHVGEDGARAVVLSGAGRAFCAGHDLKEEPAVETVLQTRARLEEIQEVTRLVRRLPALLGAERAPCPHGCDRALEYAMLTAPEKRDPALLAKLDAVAGRMLGGN